MWNWQSVKSKVKTCSHEKLIIICTVLSFINYFFPLSIGIEMCQELRWWVVRKKRCKLSLELSARIPINPIFSFTFITCFQWLMVALQIQTVGKVGEGDRRSPADWKHLGDCREHSHIIQRWLRFDSALWSDSFDLGQCACVQLPETGLAWNRGQSQAL